MSRVSFTWTKKVNPKVCSWHSIKNICVSVLHGQGQRGDWLWLHGSTGADDTWTMTETIWKSTTL